MVRTVVIAAFAFAALPAMAQDRPAWDAELWSMEEGEMLVASVTSAPENDDELVPTLALMCGGEPCVYRHTLRPRSAALTTAWTGRGNRRRSRSARGVKQVERELQFEAMDAMWATSVAADDPLVAMIQKGSELTVLMPGGGIGGNTFSLRGSTAAIAEMRKSCR